MKTIIYVTLFLSGHFCFSQNSVEKKYVLSGSKTVPNIKGSMSYVFESPDKKYICFADESMSQVFIKKTTAKGLPKSIFSSPGCGYFPTWTSKSKSILMKSKSKDFKNEAVEYVLSSNKIVNRPDLDFRAIQSLNSQLDTDPVIYVNEKLQLIKTGRKSKEILVLEGNKVCYQPVLSPDKQKVAIHVGNEIWVYSVDQKEKPQKIGTGLVTSWSMDSKFLAGFVDVSKDGHEISNSELYLYDVVNKTTHQLTNTEGVIEMNPSFSHDGKSIYYINSMDGSIMISQLKIN